VMPHWTSSLEPSGSPPLTWSVIIGRWVYSPMVRRKWPSWQVRACGNSWSCPLASVLLHWCLSG
jgi:hypothetical protein